jgi:glycosyltransferase involved in cell wall biosynthesis
MKILFVTCGGIDDPSSRVRVHQFLPYFSRHGDHVTTISLDGKTQFQKRLRRLMVLVMSTRFDTVVIQKVVLPRLTAVWSKLSKRLIYDIDDGVFVYYPDLNRVLHRYDVVVTGNSALEEHVRQFNLRSVTIPSVVDETRFDPESEQCAHSGTNPLVVGWLGTGWNLPYLEALKESFFELARRFQNCFVLKVVSNRALDWSADWIVNKEWRLEQEARDVASFDIGIMPLPEDPWSELKCGYKALLYMAMGKPVVVSPVGVNSEIVRHGINGYHASNSTEWTQHLSALLQDALLRARLGSMGRQLVADEYCIRAVLPRWLAVLRGDLEMARETSQIPKFAEDRS